MTFKHIKFDESATMREFERIGVAKGIIKEESILEKLAARKPIKKANLDPTSNLTENVIKLCSGLREGGLEAYAEELEQAFMIYKRSDNLYNVTKEEGEDLIDAAHPKGSHKLDGVDGDATIETVIDQHLADIKMIGKQPTGKLTTAAEVIAAVKMVLGQTVVNKDEIEDKNNKISILLSQVAALMRTYYSQANEYLTISMPTKIFGMIEMAKRDPTFTNLKEIKTHILELERRVKPGWIFGLSDDEDGHRKWNTLVPRITNSIRYINTAIGIANEISDIKAARSEKLYIEEQNDSEKPATPVATVAPAAPPASPAKPANEGAVILNQLDELEGKVAQDKKQNTVPWFAWARQYAKSDPKTVKQAIEKFKKDHNIGP
jgi:hypothetical protein